MGKLIKIKCTKTKCYYFRSCCRLPTEIHPVNDQIDIMIVGQGAGWQEEKQNRPWIGKAGQLLRETLKSIFRQGFGPIGLALANTVRCRPTNPVPGSTFKIKDRKPTSEEVNICIHHLAKDIEELKPKIIILTGSSAATSFGMHGSIGSLRKKDRIQPNGSIHMVTYHPAGVFRQTYLDQYIKTDLERAYKTAYLMPRII